MTEHHTPASGLPCRVSYLVESSGLGSKLLSQVAGLAGTHLGQIAKGHVSNPTGDTLGRLARVTGADLNWLILGQGEAPEAESIKHLAGLAKARLEAKTEAAA